jgi:hypothetical protein
MTENKIKEIIKNEVVEAWERLRLYTDVYGAKDDITVNARCKWVTLDGLWCKLYDEEY